MESVLKEVIFMTAGYIFYGAFRDSSYEQPIAYLSAIHFNKETRRASMTALRLEMERYEELPDNEILLIGHELYPEQSSGTIIIKAEVAAPIPIAIRGFLVGKTPVYYDYFDVYEGPLHDHVIDAEQVKDFIRWQKLEVRASEDETRGITPNIIQIINRLLFFSCEII